MNLLIRLKTPLTVLLSCVFGFIVHGKTEVTDLRCEYHINPIGIDEAMPRLSWKIVSDEMNVTQIAYEIRLANSEQALQSEGGLFWHSGKVTSGENVNVNYKGPRLSPGQRVFWQVRIQTDKMEYSSWSTPAFWETGLMENGNWKARWITSFDAKTAGKMRPCSYFRREFHTSKKIQAARIYASALGLYQLFINGKKVGDQLFCPGWTSYKKRVQYQTYDVTQLLEEHNTVGAIVGDGWYRGKIGQNQNYYGDQTALILQLQIKYDDGSHEIVSTDGSWKTSQGAILDSDIYDGEVYDARLEQGGWNKNRFNDKSWNNSTVLNHPVSLLISQQGEAVKAIQEIKPVKLISTPRGEIVFDMGQNMVGWIRLIVNGKPGTKVVMNFAEVLDKEGNFYTRNFRSAKATDIYFLKGQGKEIYEPHFTFHGFRYVKVEGFPGNPDLNSITGIVIHSDMEPTGRFSCSDPLINRLQENIVWSQKGNFLDIPSDCPQRDERLGWTGDTQIFCPTASFNFNIAPFFTKWLSDLKADQSANGAVPDVIPDVTTGGGSAGWGDAAVIVPWTLYLHYNDKQILEQQYPSMKAWVEYMRNRAGNDYIWSGDPQFGDWQELVPSFVDDPRFVTNKDFIATAYYFHTTGILAKIAAILGKTEEAEEYSTLAEKIKRMFQMNFVAPGGKLNSNTQTAYLLALAFDLLSEKQARQAASYLASYLESVGHLTTGFIGTPLLCPTLSKIGRADLAFKLLLRKEFPSWLFPITRGATTIWERWDGIRPDGTFQDASMNSLNHYVYGSIGQWLYQYVAGLNPDELHPGYRHIVLKPHPGPGLSWAKADYQSMYGSITSAWRIEKGKMFIQTQIPANTTAELILPVERTTEISVNGKKISLEPGTGIDLGSGSYQVEFDYYLN